MSDRGAVIWLTGLPASGKTTIARGVIAELDRRGIAADLLDGDVVREHISRDLGFSERDRETNVLRIAWVASRLSRVGAIAVVAAISPYAATRARARKLIEPDARFVEVYVDASLKECARRDPKGLYAQAYAGEIADFTGVSAPYEAPTQPDLHVKTELCTAERAASLVLNAALQ